MTKFKKILIFTLKILNKTNHKSSHQYQYQITIDMIEFEKTNQKGDSIKAYTHRGYLSSHYSSEISKAEIDARKNGQFIAYGTSIIAFWALNNVPKLNNFVKAKMPWRAAHIVTSVLFGQFASYVSSIIFVKQIRSKQDNLMKNEAFPAWFNKEQVVNPDRVFFQLDDNKNNEPNIWHTAISAPGIQRLIPDMIIGNPKKPHPPVAEEHHHH